MNSFDPNDKTVLQGTTVDIDDADEYLNYVVRFQNTGSASAIRVLIRDVLSNQLDWATFKPVSASHSYTTLITNGNQVEFEFDNINLPAEQDDAAGSNGFVAFKIKPIAGIQVGDIITGDASIFFDFNAPIITNTVSTEITTVLSNPEFETTDIKVYPIPANDQVFIQKSNQQEILDITLYALNGSMLLHQKEKEIIDISSIAKGVYFLKIATNKGEIVKKIIKN